MVFHFLKEYLLVENRMCIFSHIVLLTKPSLVSEQKVEDTDLVEECTKGVDTTLNLAGLGNETGFVHI